MGRIVITLDSLLKEKGVSKNKICQNCGMQRTQLNNYCKNKVGRVDLTILARLCEYIGCEVGDIIRYEDD